MMRSGGAHKKRSQNERFPTMSIPMDAGAFRVFLLILTSTARKLSDLKKENLNLIITETEKAINKDPLKDKEKYLLTYKLETLKNIIQ